jgi:hypothetical protein
LRRREVIVSASCNELCFVTASGKVRVAGKRKRLALGTARRTLAARARVVLRLRLSRSARRAIRSALRSDRKVSARIVVRARDRDGNVRSTRRVVQIVG